MFEKKNKWYLSNCSYEGNRSCPTRDREQIHIRLMLGKKQTQNILLSDPEWSSEETRPDKCPRQSKAHFPSADISIDMNL